jgi:hypothetical protein
MEAPVHGILGRDAELARVQDFLETVSERPWALLLEGAAGIGKTTLWQAGVSIARARGHRVLACRAAESEARLSYAALGDLLDSDLLHARVVMVAAVGLVPDDLAVHHRKPRPACRLVGGTHLILAGKLDRQVQPASGAQRPVKALQDRWPILRWDELHGVHTQHAVELAPVGEVLEIVLVGGDLRELRGGLGEVGAGVVDPEQPSAAGQHHREVLAGPQAASSTRPSGGSLDRNRSMNAWWAGSISP